MSDSTMMVINSTINTTVFKDVSHIDRTISIEKAKAIMVTGNANLVNITPTWHNVKCRITIGTSSVPVELKDWKSFRALVRKGLISIIDSRLTSEITDSLEEEEVGTKVAKTVKPATKTVLNRPVGTKSNVEDLVNSYNPDKGPIKVE